MNIPYDRLGGVKKIVITYHGSGDEGWIEDIYPEPPVEGFEIAHELYSELEGIGYEILAEMYPGWEINEGSHGDITIDVVERKVYVHHGEIVESTNWYDSVLE